MIEQHFYTRGLRGYETVAKSCGLADDFVKKNIHPYCVYGGVDALTLAHFSCGKMLFGLATRRDSAEQRAAFFMHNFIFPTEEVGEFLQNIGNYLYAPFVDSLDGSLDARQISHFWAGCVKDAGPEFPSVSVLRHIAALAAESVEKSKKTYVLLPPGIDSRDVIARVYDHLPYITKHRLGFCTAAVAPEKRKNIHLVFLCGATCNANEAWLSGDFFVDVRIGTGSDTTRTDFANLTEYIKTLHPKKFFIETAFWLARTPHLSEEIARAEAAWLEKNLDLLTPRQILSAPQDFIKRGKRGTSRELYVQLSILKTALKNRIPPRYLLGSYLLTSEAHERTELNLHRLLLS